MKTSRVNHLTKIKQRKGLLMVGTIDHNQEQQLTFLELEKLHEEFNGEVTALYVHQLQRSFLTFLLYFFRGLHGRVCHFHSQSYVLI